MRIHRIRPEQAPVERFARDTYSAFSKINPGELSENRLLKKAIIEEVELTSLLRDGKLVVKSFPMSFSYLRSPKETEVFQALPRNQASRLIFNDREKLVEKIEVGAECTMALTEGNSFASFASSEKARSGSPLIKI